LIGYVQKVGDRPDSVTADSTQPYAVGGFLLSGTEIMKLQSGGH
jgi:hypothetical protein